MIDRFFLESKISSLEKTKHLFFQFQKIYPLTFSERLLIVTVLVLYCNTKETEKTAPMQKAKYLITNDLITELLISKDPIESIIKKCINLDLLKKGLSNGGRLFHILTSYLKYQKDFKRELISMSTMTTKYLREESDVDLDIILSSNPLRLLYALKNKNKIEAPNHQEKLEPFEEFVENNHELLPKEILTIIYLLSKSIHQKDPKQNEIEKYKIEQLLSYVMINPLTDISVLINQLFPKSMLEYMQSSKESELNRLIAHLRTREKVEINYSEKYLINHLCLLCFKYKEIYTPYRQYLLTKKQESLNKATCLIETKLKKENKNELEIKTLYPIHKDKHIIKLYCNTYNDISHCSGLFYDIK
jgi:hypothetical protein